MDDLSPDSPNQPQPAQVATQQESPQVQTAPNSQPDSLPQQASPNKKLWMIAAIALIIIVIVGGILAFYLFKVANRKTNNSQPVAKQGNQATQSPLPATKAHTIWDDCKILSNEGDYLPGKIGEYELLGKQSAESDASLKSYGLEVIGTEGTYNVDVKGSTESADVITKTLLEKGFGISVKKGTATPDGDISKTWTDMNNQVAANQGKEIIGPAPIKAVYQFPPFLKQSYYGNDALIYSMSIKNVTTFTSLVSLIPSHNLLVSLTMSGNSDRSKDVIENYKKWFQTTCQ